MCFSVVLSFCIFDLQRQTCDLYWLTSWFLKYVQLRRFVCNRFSTDTLHKLWLTTQPNIHIPTHLRYFPATLEILPTYFPRVDFLLLIPTYLQLAASCSRGFFDALEKFSRHHAVTDSDKLIAIITYVRHARTFWALRRQRCLAHEFSCN